MTKTLEGNIKKVEVLIDNEFFTCIKSVDEEGRVECGLKMNASINKTVEHLVELYEKAGFHTEIFEA